jgi:hypothetical protein
VIFAYDFLIFGHVLLIPCFRGHEIVRLHDPWSLLLLPDVLQRHPYTSRPGKDQVPLSCHLKAHYPLICYTSTAMRSCHFYSIECWLHEARVPSGSVYNHQRYPQRGVSKWCNNTQGRRALELQQLCTLYNIDQWL